MVQVLYEKASLQRPARSGPGPYEWGLALGEEHFMGDQVYMLSSGTDVGEFQGAAEA